MRGDSKLPLLGEEIEEAEEEERTVIAHIPVAAEGLSQSLQRHAYLIVLTGSQAGAVHRLAGRDTILGRSQKCAVAIGDTGISREHAKLTLLNDDELLLQDLKSTNGTFVENKPVTSIVLRDGDRFQLGGTTLLKFSVSDEVEASFQRRLYESSVRDGLTGLHNRKHFDERLEAEFGFARRHGSILSLIIIDIDHFKRVNDTYGHQAGDEVLRVVGRALQENVRTEDIVARYGGEEFAVIARGITPDNAVVFAGRVRELIERLVIKVEHDTVSLTISAGVASYLPVLFEEKEQLVAAADRSLYEAKQLGRNRVVLAVECQGARY